VLRLNFFDAFEIVGSFLIAPTPSQRAQIALKSNPGNPDPAQLAQSA
jgi:hypothetical protein